jgi:hypothetical protein
LGGVRIGAAWAVEPLWAGEVLLLDLVRLDSNSASWRASLSVASLLVNEGVRIRGCPIRPKVRMKVDSKLAMAWFGGGAGSGGAGAARPITTSSSGGLYSKRLDFRDETTTRRPNQRDGRNILRCHISVVLYILASSSAIK